MKVTVPTWIGDRDPRGDEGIPDADESKRAADQRIPDADESKTIADINALKADQSKSDADHGMPAADQSHVVADDGTTTYDDIVDIDAIHVDADVPELRTDGKQTVWFDYETQTYRKLIHGDQRRGSGKKRPSGRFGQRGGTRNPNVQWHSMKAQAEREGWLPYFRQKYPKPLKAEQWADASCS